jgi:hypothetical protein
VLSRRGLGTQSQPHVIRKVLKKARCEPGLEDGVLIAQQNGDAAPLINHLRQNWFRPLRGPFLLDSE